MQLSPQCTMGQEYWRSVCPLICFYVIEHHIPSRVMRQFGVLQDVLPDNVDTNKELHKYVYLLPNIFFIVIT